MEETTQEEQPISMEPVSPSRTEAAEDLSSIPEQSVDTTKEPPKMVGQLEEAVNAKVNSEAAAACKSLVILDDSSTEELLANELVGEATGSISSGAKAMDKGKRKLTLEEDSEQKERLPKKKKGQPDTSLDEERIRLSALLEEKGYDFDEVLLWSVPQMAAELDKVQQQEQAAAASKAMTALTKKQKDTAYRDKMKAILLQYGFHPRQLGPMKNSTMDIHVRDIKAKIARAPPSSPSLDNMPISSVIKIKRGKKITSKQQSTDPDPERQSKADERKTEPSTTEDAGPQPIATTGAAVGSNVEDEQARDQRSQSTAQDRPRFRRRKSIARRKKRTSAISSDSEPDSPPSG
ncbi:hypothetical protein E3N88_09649 [Mikania micrantha]|uniref:Uncharacterized protein n=1 Tax=Mikania micrantha TaxID=192012 RepID=A0A5N6PLY1_9ASTR|nr:hypothetical protein E3N88_09649 [Mikania micrantha]